jgi:hypothetical protein
MDSIRIDFNDAQFKRSVEYLSGNALNMAIRRAVKKTANWIRTHVGMKLKDKTQIPRALFTARIRSYDQDWRSSGGGGSAVKVWFGFNPVFADRISKARQTASGVTIGKRKYPGAFIPTKSPRFAGKVYQRTTDHRLPIMRPRVEIENEGRAIYEEIRPQIEARLMELLRQEVNYELQKAVGNAR